MARIQIATDGRMLGYPVSGIPRYARGMTEALIRHEGFFSILSLDPIDIKLTKRSNVTNHPIPRFRFGSHTIRTAAFYASAANKVRSLGASVFWSPNHRIPPGLSKSVARVITVHDLVWKHAPETMRPLNRFLDRAFMPRSIETADAIIAVSQATASALSAEFPGINERIHVIPEGVGPFPQPKSISPLSLRGIKDPYILVVGTIEPRKNLERLITAFGQISTSTRGSAKLIIAGETGWGNVDIHRAIENSGARDSIFCLGRVDDQSLIALYSHALFLAMPSLYEGFGLPIVEALSFGIPVLTSNCSSMPEVAGPAGVLVDPLSVDSISAGIEALLDADRREALAPHVARQAKLFSWESAADQLWAVLSDPSLRKKRN